MAPTTSPKREPGYEFSAKVPQPFSPDDPMSAYTMNVVPVDPFSVVPPYVRGRSQQGLANPYQDPITSPITQTGLGPIGASLFGTVPIYPTTASDAGAAPVQTHNYEVDEASGRRQPRGLDAAHRRRRRAPVVRQRRARRGRDRSSSRSTKRRARQRKQARRSSSIRHPASTCRATRRPSFANQIVGPFTYPALPPAVTLARQRADDDPIPQPASARIVFTANGGSELRRRGRQDHARDVARLQEAHHHVARRRQGRPIQRVRCRREICGCTSCPTTRASRSRSPTASLEPIDPVQKGKTCRCVIART